MSDSKPTLVDCFVTLTHPRSGNSIRYPGSGMFKQETLDSAAKYEAKSTDIFVCAYSKCGTTWMQNIVWLIVHNGEPLKTYLEDNIPMLEFVGCDAIEAIDDSEYPRIIKTHFPYTETPQNPETKYVYVMRNPKDALVSYYYHVKGFASSQYKCLDVDFQELFNLYIQDKVSFNGYFQNVGGWYEQKHQPNILFVLYEDLKRDLRGNVLKVARFLGENYEKQLTANNDEILNKVMEECSFTTMKSKSIWTKANRPKDLPFIRKGEVGDWKNHLTKEQSETFDRVLYEKRKDSGLDKLWDDYPEVKY